MPNAFVFDPAVHGDDRGVFLESFRAESLEQATGRAFDLRQANVSVSRRGVVRGIHFADVPRGQAKYVTVLAGSVIDVVIDIRVGSPTFAQWDSVELTADNHRAVFISEGLGHLFVATSDSATVHYLTTDSYRPEREHSLHPLDPTIALRLPLDAADVILSPRDEAAPSLDDALADGILPRYDDCLAAYAAAARS